MPQEESICKSSLPYSIACRAYLVTERILIVTLMHVDKHSNMIQRLDDSTNQHSEPSLSATAKAGWLLSVSLSYFAGISIDGPWWPLFSSASTGFFHSTSRICLTCLILHSKQGWFQCRAQMPGGSSRYMYHLHAPFISSPQNMRNNTSNWSALSQFKDLAACEFAQSPSLRSWQ